jgi:hypothetical protein
LTDPPESNTVFCRKRPAKEEMAMPETNFEKQCPRLAGALADAWNHADPDEVAEKVREILKKAGIPEQTLGQIADWTFVMRSAEQDVPALFNHIHNLVPDLKDQPHPTVAG